MRNVFALLFAVVVVVVCVSKANAQGCSTQPSTPRASAINSLAIPAVVDISAPGAAADLAYLMRTPAAHKPAEMPAKPEAPAVATRRLDSSKVAGFMGRDPNEFPRVSRPPMVANNGQILPTKNAVYAKSGPEPTRIAPQRTAERVAQR